MINHETSPTPLSRRILFITLASIATIAACAATWHYATRPPLSERFARAALQDVLLDPGSAKFSNVTSDNGSSIEYICGEVNGKNRFGAYAGNTRFYILQLHLGGDTDASGKLASPHLDDGSASFEADWRKRCVTQQPGEETRIQDAKIQEQKAYTDKAIQQYKYSSNPRH